jgi:hypothetical protein
VTYDDDNGVFLVHIDDKVMPFRESPEGLHYYKPNISHQMTMVQTVEDSKVFYTTRQVDWAKKARELLHTLGCPTIADMKKAIKMNSILNCPVTMDDINLAERIFGPDVASLKVKSTRSRPMRVVSDIIESRAHCSSTGSRSLYRHILHQLLIILGHHIQEYQVSNMLLYQIQTDVRLQE